MAQGPLGFPRFTTVGPLTVPSGNLAELRAFIDHLVDEVRDLPAGTLRFPCDLNQTQRDLCDRLAYLLNDAFEARTREIFGMHSTGDLDVTSVQASNLAIESRRWAREVAEAAQDAGLFLVGQGSNRFVFSTPNPQPPDCVIKVSYTTLRGYRFENGLRENLTAVHAWKHAPLPFRDLLLPVQDFDPEGRWVTFPWVDEHLSTSQLRSFLNHLQLQTPPGWHLLTGEVSGGNTGLYEGRPVLLDYGAIDLPRTLLPGRP